MSVVFCLPETSRDIPKVSSSLCRIARHRLNRLCKLHCNAGFGVVLWLELVWALIEMVHCGCFHWLRAFSRAQL